MTYTIQDLSKGKVILENTGEYTPEKLKIIKSILNEAFPNDNSDLLGTSKYYHLWTGSEHLWSCAENVEGLDLPIQNLELFLQNKERFPFMVTTQDVALLITVFEDTPWCDAIMRNVGIEIIKTGYSTVYKEGYNTLRNAAQSTEQQEALDSIFGKEKIEWIPGAIYKVQLNNDLVGYRMAGEDYLEFYTKNKSGLLFTLDEKAVLGRLTENDILDILVTK